eukprot:TRINITY_DN1023_c0_g2_i22.p1 TRINITY_DN1023_c0_g2~~TRINITY_DN1023_c0_g2_i22.p1  ORF type:complete len:135 (-),score=21.81 TRINITY_DN1023_c0_g2_i22:94-498(-)
MELRGFVYKNQMTGLSQYTHFLYLPDLYKERELIQKEVSSFWETKCRDKLAHVENYVIDFVFIPGDEKKIFVIELNPFHPDTNGTLYRWSHDLEELKNGPLHFWVRPDYYPRGLELFSQRFLHYFPSPLLNMLK